jgi:hypothetical protein
LALCSCIVPLCTTPHYFNSAHFWPRVCPPAFDHDYSPSCMRLSLAHISFNICVYVSVLFPRQIAFITGLCDWLVECYCRQVQIELTHAPHSPRCCGRPKDACCITGNCHTLSGMQCDCICTRLLTYKYNGLLTYKYNDASTDLGECHACNEYIKPCMHFIHKGSWNYFARSKERRQSILAQFDKHLRIKGAKKRWCKANQSTHDEIRKINEGVLIRSVMSAGIK